MANSRRDFIRTGTIAALAAGISGAVAKTVSGKEFGAALLGNAPGLTKSTFAPHVNSAFTVSADGSKLAVLKLASVTDLKRPARLKARLADKEGFSLLFAGPASTTLPQGTYVIENHKLGKFTLLLVPVVTKDTRQKKYEAIINRLYPLG